MNPLTRNITCGRFGRETDRDGLTSRRTRRFYQRFFTGAFVGGRLRFLTLTTSDQAIAQGKDLHRSWAALKKRIRRRFGTFEYIAVREIKGDRHHLHMVFRGSYMEQLWISEQWTQIHSSKVVFIEAAEFARKKGMGWELAKYLGKELRHRYWASYGWVFQGWVGWSRRVCKVKGFFPSQSILRSLARLSAEKREQAQWFLCAPAMMVGP